MSKVPFHTTRKEHFSYQELKKYLKIKNAGKSTLDHLMKYKDHLDNCMACWFLWNKVRWDTAENSKGMRELKSYLKSDFIPYFDSSWAIAAKWNELSPTSEKEVDQFYMNATEYIYNLVIWHESGDRDDFTRELRKLSKQFHFQSVIDFGCGVGTDGLWLLENGFFVNFVDYECPSIRFLRWRMKSRKIEAPILDVRSIEELPPMDMFWAIDVLEHIPDPIEIVNKLNEKTYMFVHRSQFNDVAGGRHPCHISFNELRLSRALKKKGFVHVPWRKLSVWVKKSENVDKIDLH